jgi:hypothetical protein
MTCVYASDNCPVCGDCVGEGYQPRTCWDDLVPDVKEIIVARVPLLRLAQMAVHCTDFTVAYRERMKRVEAMIPSSLADPSFPKALACDLRHPERVQPTTWLPPRQWQCITRVLQGENPWVWFPYNTLAVRSCFFYGEVERPTLIAKLEYPIEVPEPDDVSVELRCVRESRFLRGTRVYAKLFINSSTLPVGVPPALGVLMSMRAAPAMRRFLEGLAADIPNAHSQGGVAVPIRRIVVLLPEGLTWLDTKWAGQICDAVTTIVAMVGGRPSGVSICVDKVYVPEGYKRWETARLPCAAPAKPVRQTLTLRQRLDRALFPALFPAPPF